MPRGRPDRPMAGGRDGEGDRGRLRRRGQARVPAERLGAAARGGGDALLFEPDELRFFSAGADQKLLTTHARGKLEPEDKGRGNNHTDLVTALIWGPGDRLYSGSRDGTDQVLAAGRRGQAGHAQGRRRPGRRAGPGPASTSAPGSSRRATTTRSGSSRSTRRARSASCSHRVHDAYALARHELSQDDPARREAALEGPGRLRRRPRRSS